MLPARSPLRNVAALTGYAIHATDGPIGTVDDLCFDDEVWTIRYFVVDTGGWLSGRKVLVSPLAIGHPDWLRQQLPAALTKTQLAHAPGIDTMKPVSRQQEEEYLKYFVYPSYWRGADLAGLAGMSGYPLGPSTASPLGAETRSHGNHQEAASTDCHLRSCRAVVGYGVHATDGDLGHVTDFLVDEDTWAIRYVIVETGHWWAGHQVLVTPAWLTAVSWDERRVSVGVTRQALQAAPPYDAARQLDRLQEQSIYEHHGRPRYWSTEAIEEADAPSVTRDAP